MNLNIVPHPVADFEITDVLQIRHIVKRLELPDTFGAETTIQIGDTARYCVDEPLTVAVIVNALRTDAGLLPLAELTLPGGKPVWFAGDQARGPLKLASGELVDGIHSAFQVGATVTRVRNSPEDVAAALAASGGKVVPLPQLDAA